MNNDFVSQSSNDSNPDSDLYINYASTDEGFRTPQDVAGDDGLLPNSTDSNAPTEPQKTSKKPGWLKRINLTKKQKIILIVVLIVLLAGLSYMVWRWRSNKPMMGDTSTPAAVQKEPAKTTEPSKLTGREVPIDVNKRQVIGVMIENSPDARPQSGLKDAGMVFEAIAEGGVTRFLALFQDTQPDYVGPIRSARPYYIEWLLGFDSAYAHVGGSPDALAVVKSQNVKDLDQFANAGSYQRVNNRYAPHNVYTSIAKLSELAKSKGWSESNYTGFKTKADAPIAPATHKSIDATMSGFLYNPHWEYDAATNSYARSQAGKPHTDEKSGQAITSKVVIMMVASKGTMSDGYHTTYTTTGSGKVIIFQDGGSKEGTWTKVDSKSQIKFTDANGQEMELNAGQRWVTVVSADSNVSAKP